MLDHQEDFDCDESPDHSLSNPLHSKRIPPVKSLFHFFQTGNFRVDSRGKQRGVKEIKYAGSETHISELLEKVCQQMQNYGETSDPKTGKKGYMRINSRAGETITISNVNFSSGGTQQLQAAVSGYAVDQNLPIG